MPQVTEAEVFRACRTLFGPELQFNREFLAYLQPAGARSAYRKKAKVIHPDRFAVAAAAVQARQHRLFQDLNQAHQTIQDYLKQQKTFSSGHVSRQRGYTQPQRRQQEPETPKRPQPGPLPPRPLQFGLFLYYLGIVPFKVLVEALTWQRRQRPVFGEIARRWGWLSDEDIRRIINYRGGLLKFGERAERLGLLSSLQVRTLLYHQRTRQKQIGDYFVQQGLFDETTLHRLLAQLAEHNRTYRRGSHGYYYFYHR